MCCERSQVRADTTATHGEQGTGPSANNMSYCVHHQANNMVCTTGASREEKKSGKVRICADSKKLSEEVKRETFILPTIYDVTSKLTGATIFTYTDAASGFYQIPLHDDSQELTTVDKSYKWSTSWVHTYQTYTASPVL